MFKSYSYKYLNYNPETKLYNYEVIVEDDKFGSETVGVRVGVGGRVGAGVHVGVGAGVHVGVGVDAIIQIYSRRNLNVAKNLFLFMRYIEKKYSWWTISKQIEYYKKYIHEYNKYHQEVQKFLLFS